MGNGKIIWWVIVIGIAIYLIYKFGFSDNGNKCCRIVTPISGADIPEKIYCKRGDKYYVTIAGGITGGEYETEITEQEYKIALNKFTCK